MVSKERREKLERKMQSGNSVPVKDVRIDSDDLRALLDERDRYRALLEQCREIAKAAINSGDWVVDGARDPDMVFDRIDAALEGNDGD